MPYCWVGDDEIVNPLVNVVRVVKQRIFGHSVKCYALIRV